MKRCTVEHLNFAR